MKSSSLQWDRAAIFLCSIAALLATALAVVRAQSALDGFDPNANGIIHAAVVQSDGKILIGGDFTTVSPNGGAAVSRTHLARLNPDGTLDLFYFPEVNGSVYAIAVEADGNILIGGDFTIIGVNTRNHIARLDASGAVDMSFTPNANDVVRTIAVQANGKILVGGVFKAIGPTTRNHIARLNATTGAADSFNPDADDVVRAIVVEADGRILVGGQFVEIDGRTRNHIARLDASGAVDMSFTPNANDVVRAIAVQANGKIVVGGLFTTIGPTTRNHIARLNATTGAADSFNPDANDDVLSIAVQPDGKILAGGDFNGANSIGGQARNRIARLDATTGLADSFDPDANDTVLSVAVQPDGKILAGGDFNSLSPSGGVPATRNNIARLENDGRLDQTINSSVVNTGNSSYVYTTAVQPDGKILIGGNFFTVLGEPRNKIARFNTDGTLDTAFNPNADGIVLSIAVQPDGKILVGGYFTHIGGQSHTTSPGSMPRPERPIRSRQRTMLLVPSRCSRTARYWWAVCSRASAGSRAISSPGSIPRSEHLIRSTRTRTILSMQSRCRQTARSWWADISPLSPDRRATASRASTPPERPTISTQTRTMLSTQSRCRRMARYWRAACSQTLAADRATASRGSMPRSERLMCRSIRTRALPLIQSRCRPTARSWRAACLPERTASVDRRATSSPGSIPPPAWLIRSTPMFAVSVSIRSRRRRTASSCWEGISPSLGHRRVSSSRACRTALLRSKTWR